MEIAPLVAILRKLESRCYSRWQAKDGKIVETPLTDSEYAALGVKGAGEPNRTALVPADAVWLHSTGGASVWDTPSGLLEFGHYEDCGGKLLLLGIGNLDPVRISADTLDEFLKAVQDFQVDGVAYQLNAGMLEKL